MKINLFAGNEHRSYVTKQDIDKNIQAQERAIEGNSLAGDYVLLIDTKSILEAIRTQLPERTP